MNKRKKKRKIRGGFLEVLMELVGAVIDWILEVITE